MPAFAREKLRWLLAENASGRLDVAFYVDTDERRLPGDVLMAPGRADGTATIYIAKSRFARFLQEGGYTGAPFVAQQKNDFALALRRRDRALAERRRGSPRPGGQDR